MNQKALVVDLDGTLMDTNTFKDYIIYVCMLALKKVRLDLVFLLCFLVFLRKTRLVSHELMKRLILLASKSLMNEKYLSDFVDTLWPKINVKVQDIISQWQDSNEFVLLSTAAPESYALIIAKRLALNGCSATPMPKRGINWKENVRRIKCENTLLFLGENNLTLEVFLTDHYDDLPFLKVAKKQNLIVNPSARTISCLNKNCIKYEIIKNDYVL